MTGFKLFRDQNTFRLNLFITFVGFLDTFLIIPIIALYAVRLGATVGSVGLIIGLYSITNTPANILFGRVIDRLGYHSSLGSLVMLWPCLAISCVDFPFI